MGEHPPCFTLPLEGRVATLGCVSALAELGRGWAKLAKPLAGAYL
jgi:hypothetical protein